MRRAPSLLFLLMLVGASPQRARAEEYVAFSLGAAQRLIAQMPAGEDYRESQPEAFRLAGITRVRGLVYDRASDDAILIGQRDPEGTELTLDDVAVALQARLVRGEWPEVSIDPRAEGGDRSKRQDVRFKGGIEDTAFGYSLFGADYLLKKIGMNMTPAQVPGLRTDADLARQYGSAGSSNVLSRYWFYPTALQTVIREDIATIKGLRVAVFTEVLAASMNGVPVKDLADFHPRPSEEFARQVSARYGELARQHPSFARVQGMEELVALAHAVEQMDPRPGLTYWLTQYSVKRQETPREVEVLRRSFTDRRATTGGIEECRLTVSGGVSLRAIALRATAGDVTALREAVMRTRPATEALRWTFTVTEWGIGGPLGEASAEQAAQLLSHGHFLAAQNRHGDAVAAFTEAMKVLPDAQEIYLARGLAYQENGDFASALQDFDRALQLAPDSALAYLARAACWQAQREFDRAVEDCSQAIARDPGLAMAHLLRGLIRVEKGDLSLAGADFDAALVIEPTLSTAYLGQGLVLMEQKRYREAVEEFSRGLTVGPTPELYLRRAVAYWHLGATLPARRDLEAVMTYGGDERVRETARQLRRALDYVEARDAPPRRPLTPPNIQ